MRARVIGVDVGTSGVRVAALAEDGTTVGAGAVSMATIGGDPASPETWWQGVSAALGQLRASCDLGGVRALAVDGTSGTMLAVDGAGAPVGPARMYDQPCDDEDVIRAIAENAPAASAALGRASALARVLMMQDRPGVRRMLHQADWIAGRLSGRFDRSDANNALKTGYDPVACCWPEWIERAGADIGKLPVVMEPGAPIGPAGPEAVALGVPARAIIHAGTTDGCASFLATGAAEIGDGVSSLGSTLVVKLLCERPIFAPEFGIYSHRIGSGWLAGGASNTGGRVIERLFPRDRIALTVRGSEARPAYRARLLSPCRAWRALPDQRSPGSRRALSLGQATKRPSFKPSSRGSRRSRRWPIASSPNSARPRSVRSGASAAGPQMSAGRGFANTGWRRR